MGLGFRALRFREFRLRVCRGVARKATVSGDKAAPSASYYGDELWTPMPYEAHKILNPKP